MGLSYEYAHITCDCFSPEKQQMLKVGIEKNL